VLRPEQWKQPLPDRIQFNTDHSPGVGDIVGSGTPWIDEAGNLRVRGKYASIELGQHIRSLVNEGHLTAVSVEFLAAALLAHSPDDDGPLQIDDLSAVEIATASLQLINCSTAYCAVPVGTARVSHRPWW
jgi:hypothetical protein